MSSFQTCPNWQVGGEAHFHRAAIQLAKHALHSKLVRSDLPWNDGQDLSTVFREGNAGEDEENETHIASDYDYSAGAGGGTRRSSCPAKQGFGDADGHGAGAG
jgi:hypothetical protein